jgi:hypothetical protein
MIHIVRQGGDRLKNPDSTYGFGLPDFFRTYFSITGISRRMVPGHLEVYPNPASEMIMVKVPGQEAGLQILGIYDFSGRKVHVMQTELPGQVDLPGALSPGIYILEINTNDGVYRSRLIIE